ncbi:anti-sigma factor antagonist [Paenibacillus sp. LMG 31456]|uniref:Anti-sigma factor antagonist n=1 Tax=Paenibacillus foliorum TaxID=2654974 RepID=A0A972GQS1_9BACL|nr:anti-sigma factor antagonist [Paenibacillus foliorum]
MIKEVRVSGGAFIIELQGEFTKDAEQPLMSLRDWKQGLGENVRVLIFDFQQVSSISSRGITLLMRIACWGAEGNYQAFGHGVAEHYQKLFRLLGLTQFMMIYPDEYSILQRVEGVAD